MHMFPLVRQCSIGGHLELGYFVIAFWTAQKLKFLLDEIPAIGLEIGKNKQTDKPQFARVIENRHNFIYSSQQLYIMLIPKFMPEQMCSLA